MERRLPIAERMTNKAMVAMIPLYVRGEVGTDHKCGGCNMRVEIHGDRAYCTVMHGEISLGRGVCNYWAPGKASEFKDISTARMTKESASYVDYPGAINCGSCQFLKARSTPDALADCKLWKAEVALGDCCIAWEASPAPYMNGRVMSERWSRALNEGVGTSFTNRYDALGIPLPDPITMCKDQCEGTGYVPICEDDPEEPWRTLFLQAEAENPTDDGWHFVRCPTCEGTGLANPHEAHVAEIAETAPADSPGVRASKRRIAELLKR